MSEKIYAYGRVSTKEQNLDRQLIAFQNLGIPSEHYFLDKESGKDFDRVQYRRLMDVLEDGDTVVIASLDRFGRGYEETIEQWRHISREKGVNIKVLNAPILDTAPKRDLMGTVISNVVLQIQSAFAQMERDSIRQRQAEGIAAARARGVRFGPKPQEPPEEFETLRQQWAEGSISAQAAATRLGVCRKTFMKWVKNVGEYPSGDKI